MRAGWMVAVMAGLALAGCANQERVELVQRADTAMLGMPKSQLLSCAGVPERQARADGAEFYTYASRPGIATAGPATSIGIAGGSGGGFGVGLGLGIPLLGGARPAGGCEMTFVLRGGVVERITRPGGAYLPDCAPIVDNCMAPAR